MAKGDNNKGDGPQGGGNFELSLRVLVMSVNRVLNVMTNELGLNPLEQAAVLSEAINHLQKAHGITVEFVDPKKP